jgi:elongation factor P
VRQTGNGGSGVEHNGSWGAATGRHPRPSGLRVTLTDKMPADGFKHAAEHFRGEPLGLRIIVATVLELRPFFGQSEEMAKVLATEIRSGNLIEWDKRVWRVLKSYHVHVGGRGGAFMQVEMKDIESGTKRNERIRTEDKIERAHVEHRDMQFLYKDGSGYVFMDRESFEQLTLAADFLEEQSGYLIPNTDVQVNFHNERPIGIQMPPTVTLTVMETEPNLKGATATGSFKPARTDTGLTVMVPQFVTEGEKINVNTDTGAYIDRA